MEGQQTSEVETSPSAEKGAGDQKELQPSNEAGKGNDVDDELEELLESALSDFGSSKSTGPKSTPFAEASSTASLSSKVTNSVDETDKGSTPSASASAQDPNNDEYSKLDEMLKPILEKDPQLREHWQKLSESCNKAANAKSDEEFESSFQETLQNLVQSAQNIATDSEVSDDELARIWSSLGMQGANPEAGNQLPPDFGRLFSGEAAGGGPEFMHLITNMMQNFLSKELLYPALKDLSGKYPEWLTENKDKISSDDLRRYERQLDLMENVCKEYEEEQESDSAQVKQDRFKRILDLMQEMQKCGAPPTDLVADVPEIGTPDFTQLGAGFPPMNPNATDPNQQCSIM